VLDFGVKGDGTTDDSANIIDAITQASAAGGKELYFPGGRTYLCNSRLYVQATHKNVTFVGDGEASIIKRGANLTAGQGLFDIYGSAIGLRNLQIEGDVLTSVGLTYASFSFDPMAAVLTTNSSVWVHQGAQGVTFENVTIRHSGGYAILVDADTADVSDIRIEGCLFENNRPHLFGLVDGSTSFGAWTGGVLLRGDCRNSTSKPFSVKGVRIANNRFHRMNGNCAWMHSYGFDVKHENVVVTGNEFKYIARDGWLAGNLIGGSCSNNTARFIGFTHTTDSSTPVGAYLADNYAVAYDSSGFVSNHPFVGNVAEEFYGGGFDLDGLRDSIVAGNSLASSQPIAKGIQTGDTSANGGGDNVIINNNQIRGCNAGAIVLNQAAGCLCENNSIVHPTGAGVQPILLYSLNKATKDTIVRHNDIYWEDAGWAVVESDGGTGSGFDSTTSNLVYGNTYRGGVLGEFYKSPVSSSKTGMRLSTNAPTPSTEQASTLQREGVGAGAALKLYDKQGSTQTQFMQFQFDNGLMNISENGAAQTGIVTTGPRTTLGFNDAIWTGKVMGDGFLAIYNYLGSATSYQTADANTLSDDWFLLRYNKASSVAEISVSATLGVRNWVALGGGGGGGLSGLTAGRVPYSTSATTIADTANLTWNNTSRVLTITGATGTAGIVAATSFMQSSEGFLTTSTASTAINAASGGVTALSLISVRNDGSSGLTLSRTAATARDYGMGVDSSGQFFLRDATAGAVRLTMSPAGLITIGSSVAINQTGSVTISATLQAAGVNVTGSSFNSLQVPTGGLFAGLGLTTDQALYPKTFATATMNAPGGGYGGFAHKAGTEFWVYSGGAWTAVNLASAAISGLTTGRIPYANSASSIANTVVYWDNTNSRLGVNKPVPGTTLHVGGQGFFDGAATGAGLTCADGYIESTEGFLATLGVFNTFQNTAGGSNLRNSNASVYSKLGVNFGIPTVTTGDSISTSMIYWDTSVGRLQVYNGSSWVATGLANINSLTGPALTITNGTGVSVSSGGSTITISNTGVTSVFGTTNQVNVSASTGSITLSLPQSIATSSTPTFSGVISNGAFNANVSGTSIAFQTASTTIQINGNGLISTSAGMNVNGSAFVDSSRNVTASSVVASGNIQCGASSNYGVAGGFFGQDATGGLVCGSRTLFFKGGILYAWV
jgi:hypothetical protein